MANMFSLFLVIVTLITGIVWAIEKFVWSKKRLLKIEEAEKQTTDGLTDEQKEKVAPQGWFVENSVSIFPVIAFVLILRSFLYEPFQIPSGSMMPTLLNGDFILVQKFSYGIKDPVFQSEIIETGKPQRGDIAVFRYPPQPNIDYIKRVVGLPGDTVRYSADKQICVQTAGESECKLVVQSNSIESEFRLDNGIQIQKDERLGDVDHKILITNTRPNNTPAYYGDNSYGSSEWVVPEGQYFMMGDNRDNSGDSRYWGFVPEENFVGKAVFKWISFEFGRDENSLLPSWIPTSIRFNRIGNLI